MVRQAHHNPALFYVYVICITKFSVFSSYLKYIMEKRAFDRIPSDIRVIFFSGTQEYYGTVTNLSEKGMFINTEVNFPLQLQLKILMPWQTDTLWLHAMIRSFGTSGNSYNGIGVELVSPSPRYLEFVDSLRN